MIAEAPGAAWAASRLFSGQDVLEAKEWSARRPKNAPAPTELHLEFIRASEDFETQQKSAELRRLQQMAEAQSARELALADKEAAQQREAIQSRRVVRRTPAGLAGVLVLAVIAIGISIYAMQKRGEADKTRDEALLAQSQYLADLAADTLSLEHNAGTAILLALEALPDAQSWDATRRDRPFWGGRKFACNGR